MIFQLSKFRPAHRVVDRVDFILWFTVPVGDPSRALAMTTCVQPRPWRYGINLRAHPQSDALVGERTHRGCRLDHGDLATEPPKGMREFEPTADKFTKVAIDRTTMP
jgi:hypothetical protein